MPASGHVQSARRIVFFFFFVAALATAVFVGAARPGSAAPATTTQTVVDVEVDNPDGLLSQEDTESLLTQTPKLSFPQETTHVLYLAANTYNEKNFNEGIENYLKEHHPEALTSRKDKFAYGYLIVTVGAQDRKMGVFCGDDVCSALDLTKDRRLGEVIHHMEEPLGRKNWSAGLYRGAEAATDLEGVTAPKDNSGPHFAGMAAGWAVGVAAIGGIFAVIFRRARRVSGKKLRSQWLDARRRYGEIAPHLDEINVQAHSLSSPLANDTLRAEWKDIREQFLAVHQHIDELDTAGIGADSSDRELRSHRSTIEELHTAVTRMSNAQENIDHLWKMEHGSTVVRREAIEDLRSDLVDAGDTASAKELKECAKDLTERSKELEGDLESADFMEKYAALLRDAKEFNDRVRKELHRQQETKQQEHEYPSIGDRSWRVGTGYYGYVPFATLYQWHQNDAASYSASSSSSSTVNTTFSSGFSGGGGSGSF